MAWSWLRGIRLHPWELDAIARIDAVWVRVTNEAAEKRTAKPD